MGAASTGWNVWAWASLALWAAIRWPILSAGAVVPSGLGAVLAAPDPRAVAGGPWPHLVLPVAVVLLALAPGGAILGRLGPASIGRAERLIHALGLGLGALATVQALLALAGLFAPGAVLAAAPIVGLVALVLGGAAGREPYRSMASLAGRARSLLRDEPGLAPAFWLSVPVLGMALLKAMTPPWYPDALYYQLTLPGLYLESGGFLKIPGAPVTSSYPGLVQMLNAIPLAAGWDDVAATFGWLFLCVTIAATLLAARHLLGPESVFPAVALLLATPHLVFVSATPLADAPFVAYLTLALHATVRASSSAERGWSNLAALSMGLAVATKYQAFAFVPLLAAGLWWIECRQEGFARGSCRTAGLAFLAALPFAPWAIKNQVAWGNPLFPLLVPGTLDANLKGFLAAFQAEWLTHGHGSSLPWLPFDLALFARPDDLARYEGDVGPLWLAVMPLVAILPPRSTWVRALAAGCLVEFLVWSAGARETRYLFPVLPALAIVCAGPLTGARPSGSRALVVAGTLVALAWTAQLMRPAQDAAYLLGAESRPRYLSSLGATRDLFLACESLKTSSPLSRVLFFWDDRGYFCPRPFLADHLMPASSSHRLHELPADPRAALARLRDLEVTHLLVNVAAWEEARAARVPWRFDRTFVGIARTAGVSRTWPPPGQAAGVHVLRLPWADAPRGGSPK